MATPIPRVSGYLPGKYQRGVYFNSDGTLGETLRIGEGGAIEGKGGDPVTPLATPTTPGSVPAMGATGQEVVNAATPAAARAAIGAISHGELVDEVQLVSGAAPIPRVFNKLYSIATGTTAQLRVLMVGDSMSLQGDSNGSVGVPFVTQLQQAWGVQGGGVSPTNALASGASTITGSSLWPTTDVVSIPAGGTLTLGNGGLAVTCDTIKIYYALQPGAGTFKIQTSTDGTTWNDEAGFTNVSAANATISLGIATITKTRAAYFVRVVGLTGTVIVPHTAGGIFFDSTASGVALAYVSKGGLGLDTFNASNAAIWAAFLADYAPDLILFEMKEGAAEYAANLAAFQARVTTPADIIYIMSTPVQDSAADADQVAQNAILLSHALANGATAFDAYSLFGSWIAANGFGWTSDGVHRSARGGARLASALLHCGILDFVGGRTPVANASGFVIGPTVFTGTPSIRADIRNSTSGVALIRFDQATATDGAQLEATTDTYSNPANIAGSLYVRTPNAGSSARRVRFTADGKILIGGSLADDGLGPIIQAEGVVRGVGLWVKSTNFNASGAVSTLLFSNASAATAAKITCETTAFGNAANVEGDFFIWARAFGGSPDRKIVRVSGGAGNLHQMVGDVVIDGAGRGIRYGGTGGPIDTYGAGSPEGVLSAPVGSTYRRTNGGAGTSFYVKESGTGNTGWVAK